MEDAQSVVIGAVLWLIVGIVCFAWAFSFFARAREVSRRPTWDSTKVWTMAIEYLASLDPTVRDHWNLRMPVVNKERQSEYDHEIMFKGGGLWEIHVHAKKDFVIHISEKNGTIRLSSERSNHI